MDTHEYKLFLQAATLLYLSLSTKPNHPKALIPLLRMKSHKRIREIGSDDEDLNGHPEPGSKRKRKEINLEGHSECQFNLIIPKTYWISEEELAKSRRRAEKLAAKKRRELEESHSRKSKSSRKKQSDSRRRRTSSAHQSEVEEPSSNESESSEDESDRQHDHRPVSGSARNRSSPSRHRSSPSRRRSSPSRRASSPSRGRNREQSPLGDLPNLPLQEPESWDLPEFTDPDFSVGSTAVPRASSFNVSHSHALLSCTMLQYSIIGLVYANFWHQVYQRDFGERL